MEGRQEVGSREKPDVNLTSEANDPSLWDWVPSRGETPLSEDFIVNESREINSMAKPIDTLGTVNDGHSPTSGIGSLDSPLPNLVCATPFSVGQPTLKTNINALKEILHCHRTARTTSNIKAPRELLRNDPDGGCACLCSRHTILVVVHCVGGRAELVMNGGADVENDWR